MRNKGGAAALLQQTRTKRRRCYRVNSIKWDYWQNVGDARDEYTTAKLALHSMSKRSNGYSHQLEHVDDLRNKFINRSDIAHDFTSFRFPFHERPSWYHASTHRARLVSFCPTRGHVLILYHVGTKTICAHKENTPASHSRRMRRAGMGARQEQENTTSGSTKENSTGSGTDQRRTDSEAAGAQRRARADRQAVR